MECRGSLECRIGRYLIFHRIMIGPDGKKQRGFELVGPGTDSSWNYRLDIAIKTAEELEATRRFNL
jgi:hypothetical protein